MITVHNTSHDAQIEALQCLGIHTIQDLGRYADAHGLRPTDILEAAAARAGQ